MFIHRVFGLVGIRDATKSMLLRRSLRMKIRKLKVSSMRSGVVTVMPDAFRKILSRWLKKSKLVKVRLKKAKRTRVVQAAKFVCQKTETGRRAIWQISLIGI